MLFIKHSKHSGKILSRIYHKFTLDLCEYGPSSELGLGIAKKRSDAVSLPKKSVMAGEADRWMDN